MSKFDQMDPANFRHIGYPWRTLHCILTEFGYFQNNGTFLWNLIPISDPIFLSLLDPVSRN